MSMTKKDYELIAKAIKPNKESYHELDGNACQLVYKIAEALQTDNLNFQKDKFLKACGIEV